MVRIKTLFPALAISGALLVSVPASADSPDILNWLISVDRKKGVEPVTNDTWAEECGACHVAYPPGLLPARSWKALLAPKALADHFGENAELDEDTLKVLTEYATTHAADQSLYKRSRKIMASIRDDETPLRITETRYIRRKHGEIPEKYIKGNPKVGSLSNCNACHTEIDKGVFDDDTVIIPGVGRDWEDD
ncbi:diheme cytochrome c [Hahella sp. SMD15-11]|uniref:Diheme cytochrome c n=1 Tax=Thermohahella caldifontis TaxID=3142973 RepID=A0AB39UYI2_9GAMM